MILATHVGVNGYPKLVLDDRDRVALVRALVKACGVKLLAYCIMDTHLHVVIEAPPEVARRLLENALAIYVKGFKARHGSEVVRDGIHTKDKCSSWELAKTINYDHDNPIRPKVPIVQDGLFFEWSSAQSFAGLSAAPAVNVKRARSLAGGERVGPRPPEFAGLEPVACPREGAGVLLVAAAQTFGCLPDELVRNNREPAAMDARAVFVALGRLEGYRDTQLGHALERTQSGISRIGSGAVDAHGVVVARTLLTTPGIVERLRLRVVEPARVEPALA